MTSILHIDAELRIEGASGPQHSLAAIYKNALILILIVLCCCCPALYAQKTTAVSSRKLPSAERVVDDYLKAIGGKNRVLTIHDAAYQWTLELNGQTMGTAKTQTKVPSSLRTEMTFGNGQLISAASASSAWETGLDGVLHTLTGPEAAAARLQAVLQANHLSNYKKLNVLARVVSVSDLNAEPTYIVEFSTRNGARLRYWFSAANKLLVKIEDEARKTTARFSDYRRDAVTDPMEPHRIAFSTGGAGELMFRLERASYNQSPADSTFDPPRGNETLDVPALLREVERNQDEVEKRVSEYAFMQKETDREISDKGELKKETAKVFEVFPVAHREPIMKLISENGVALSGEKAAKEEKRVQEEFLKAERDQGKNDEKAERRKVERQRKQAEREQKGQDADPELSQFLKVCEFVSPRRELFRDRNAIVFDFRPRAGFKPTNRQESLISKLVGVVWIDPVDKQIMRLEAKLAEGFKMAGGLVLSLRPGAAFVMEQTRMVEGIWLPRLAQINLSVKVLLFGGGDFNKTIEWSDYKHFKGDVGDYKLDAPKPPEVPNKKP